jgi:hypothetical protein
VGVGPSHGSLESVTSTSEPLLAGYQLDLDAQVGRATPGAPAIVRRLGAASADVVVVALGTNDAGNGSRYESLARAVAAEASPAAHLVWVLPHRFTSEMDGIRRSVASVLAHRPRRPPRLTPPMAST